MGKRASFLMKRNALAVESAVSERLAARKRRPLLSAPRETNSHTSDPTRGSWGAVQPPEVSTIILIFPNSYPPEYCLLWMLRV